MSAAIHSTPGGHSSDGCHHHHNRDFVLQKYLLLQEQHESLSQRLDQLRPLATLCHDPGPTLGSPLTAPSSPSSSPTQSSTVSSRQHARQHNRSSSPTVSQHPPQRRSTVPSISARRPFGLETVPDERMMCEVAEEEAKLFDVNEGIKRALTELLNCEAVRADRALRTWVQCRLMETEKELRTGRRRRSGPGI